MSYIAPNGTIWLLHNVPLDKTYQNTLYWSAPSQGTTAQEAQRNYFIGNGSTFVKYTFTNQYYTRHEKGSIRVAVLADQIFDCNYMVFQNSSFGAKYFYAFITSVEYINNAVAQVNFEIDVIQTWYFDYRLEPCFVERMHTRTDNRYENLAPEPIEPGEYTYQIIYHELVTQPMYIILAVVSVDTATGSSDGKMYSNIYGGCTLFAFQTNDMIGINGKISEFIAQPDAVVGIYMCPQCLITAAVDPGGVELTASDIRIGTTDLITALPEPAEIDDFGTYTPHNNKLYSYPYSMLEVFTAEGAKANYRYEFFNTANHTPSFVYGGCVTQPVELTLVPKNYKIADVSLTENELFTETIGMKDYPLCSWNIDAYKAWVAQNAVPLGISVAGHVVGGAIGIVGAVASGNPFAIAHSLLGTGGSLANDITNIVSQNYTASIQADVLNGQSKGSANIGMGKQGFFFAHKVVNEASAKIIDSYFDRFGYAIKRVVEPIRKNRKYYTYIKTVGCVLHGSIPADDEEKICSLHDAGITYWDVAETHDIGNFNLAVGNLPVGGA